MDPYPLIAHRYDPVFPLSAVAQYQANNWYPATDWELDQTGNYPKLQPEVPGGRAPVRGGRPGRRGRTSAAGRGAAEQPGARFVTPTGASMTAALNEMVTAPQQGHPGHAGERQERRRPTR